MSAVEFAADIRREALRLGFSRCNFVAVGEAPHADFFAAWLNAGNAGDMGYLLRNEQKRRFPALLARRGDPPFRTLIVLAGTYSPMDLPETVRNDPSRGILASYAWGGDYHDVLRPRLYALDESIRNMTGRTFRGKALVDSGPVLERDWAATAGVGFTGKNCCTIHPEDGSWFVLATLLIPEEIPAEVASTTNAPEPSTEDVLSGLPPRSNFGSWQIPLQGGDTATGTCGRCSRCIGTCPTQAFVGPYYLSPARCISYWTIETQAPIPRDLRARFANRIFGCDICQEVCPWNLRRSNRVRSPSEFDTIAGRVAPPLLEGFGADDPYWLAEDAFARRFAASPVMRATRSGMLRNVCVALGNWGARQTVSALENALDDPSSVVRGHAAWALGRVAPEGRSESVQILTTHRAQEQDRVVLDEVEIALRQLTANGATHVA